MNICLKKKKLSSLSFYWDFEGELKLIDVFNLPSLTENQPMHLEYDQLIGKWKKLSYLEPIFFANLFIWFFSSQITRGSILEGKVARE